MGKLLALCPFAPLNAKNGTSLDSDGDITAIGNRNKKGKEATKDG